MKKSLMAVAFTGCVAGFILRLIQCAFSINADGMIVKGDGISTVLYIVCILVGVLSLVICLRSPKGTIPIKENKKTPFRGILEIISGVALIGAYLPPTLDAATIDYVMLFLAFVTACSFAVEGAFHIQGREGSLLGGCLLPVYLAVLLVKDYRSWAYNPLVFQYAFQLLFLVLSMVAGLELAAFRVGKGKQRLCAFFVACAICVAGPALADGGFKQILHTVALALYIFVEFLPYLHTKPVIEKNTEKASETVESAPTEESRSEDIVLEEEYSIFSEEIAFEEDQAISLEEIDSEGNQAVFSEETAFEEDQAISPEEITLEEEQAIPLEETTFEEKHSIQTEEEDAAVQVIDDDSSSEFAASNEELPEQ